MVPVVHLARHRAVCIHSISSSPASFFAMCISSLIHAQVLNQRNLTGCLLAAEGEEGGFVFCASEEEANKLMKADLYIPHLNHALFP